MSETERSRGSGLLLKLLILAVIVIAVWFFWPSSPVPDRTDNGMIAAEDSLNVLVVGSDENVDYGVSGRADAILLVHVDLSDETLYILSIPRDTLVEIPGYGQDKINHAYAYGGIELLKSSVEGLLNVPMDYYATTDFNGFADIVDVLGGVEIDVDKRMYYQTYDGLIDIQAGLQTLNGEQALQYVRYRQDALGDITRVSRQQNFLTALVDQCLDVSIIPKLPQLVSVVMESVNTDLPVRDIVKLSFRFMDFDDLSALDTDTLPGDFADINGISYWRPSETAVAELVGEHFGETK